MSATKTETKLPKPLGDKVVLKPLDVSDVLQSGLVLPSQVTDKIKRGLVVAVGRGYLHPQTLEILPLETQVGDTVAYGDYGVTEVQVSGVTYLVISEAALVAVIPE